jgi:hypothetical protein
VPVAQPPRRHRGWWSKKRYLAAIIGAVGAIAAAAVAAAVAGAFGSTTIVISPTPAQPRQVTYPETAGGVSHTWTNYSTGGGEQGPLIGAHATVQVSCRVSGLRVRPDNNPWWYQVASAPWNGKFYVSADAFYNNGQVAGSLLNTPWFDKRVRMCI